MKADLHIHTTFSDGISTPEEIVETAIKRGINCICITDHHEINGSIEAMKFGYDKNILVIPGIELLTTSGDVLGINVKKNIPSGLSVKEAIKEIRKQGGIAVIPHPFNKPVNGFWGGEKDLKKINFDAIESFNATVFFKSSNKKADNFSKSNNLCFTAGSDAHRKDFVGRGYIEVSDNIKTEKDLILAILEKRAKTGGKKLTLVEIFKNSSHANVNSIIKYYNLKRKKPEELEEAIKNVV